MFPFGLDILTTAVKVAINIPKANEIKVKGIVYLIPAQKICGVEVTIICHISLNSPNLFNITFLPSVSLQIVQIFHQYAKRQRYFQI